MSDYRLNTKCVQGGYTPGNGEPRQIPIIQSTTFKYDTSADMGKLFDLESSGYFYSRLQNPTNDYVAAKIAELAGVTVPAGTKILIGEVESVDISDSATVISDDGISYKKETDLSAIGSTTFCGGGGGAVTWTSPICGSHSKQILISSPALTSRLYS